MAPRPPKSLLRRIEQELIRLGAYRKMPVKDVERITTENIDRAVRAIRNFKQVEKEPAFATGEGWYDAPEVMAMLGGAESEKAKLFADLFGVTSANNPVYANVGQTVALYPSVVAAKRGEGPLTPAALREKGLNPFLPAGIGSVAHRTSSGLLASLIEGKPLSSADQPKMFSYAANTRGDHSYGTIDSHMQRTATGDMSASVPGPLQYAGPEAALRIAAEDADMTPANYQAAVWLGNADRTGVAKGSRDDLPRELVPEFMRSMAKAAGQAPDTFIKRWLGGDPSLWVGETWSGRLERPARSRAMRRQGSLF